MVDFNQYYTSKNLSDLLTKFTTLQEPNTCLELSAGEGALLDAVKSKWADIKCTTIDIDPINHSLLIEKFPFDEHFCFDATSSESFSTLLNRKFDLAVCNPPFELINTSKSINEYVFSSLGLNLEKSKKIRAEIAFIAINLTHLNENGILAIIVPELIINGLKLSKFRESLFSNYKIENIIECEQKAFKHTEAKTYILFLRNIKPSNQQKFTHIIIDSNAQLKLETQRDVKKTFFTYEKNKKNTVKKPFEIIRGRLSGKECKLSGHPYIHTTNMNLDMEMLSLSGDDTSLKYRTAKAGDIIIARVGTRVLGKTNIIKSGGAIISDCLFSIRFSDEKNRNKFIEFWKENKKTWITENSTGTCARHITISSMSNLIISLLA
ncbi:N-6 DNA methylase [Pantoea sp. S61]|uniref:N-6 DNA methylase n=1 Tax=Pantoea sp. S61 TaxID=2767442 RepID=UPI001909E78F|nr:N-6 DNA methylase [Pantoea sp. S61]